MFVPFQSSRVLFHISAILVLSSYISSSHISWFYHRISLIPYQLILSSQICFSHISEGSSRATEAAALEDMEGVQLFNLPDLDPRSSKKYQDFAKSTQKYTKISQNTKNMEVQLFHIQDMDCRSAKSTKSSKKEHTSTRNMEVQLGNVRI